MIGGPLSPAPLLHASRHAAGGADDLSGTYARRRPRVVLPESYGALGDGVADDTSAIASAIAAGDVVLLDPGKTYLVSVVTVTAGKTLCSSDGGRATIKAKAGLTASVVRVEGSGSSLLDVIVDGDKASQTSTSAIPVVVNGALATVSDVMVRNVEIKNGYGDGMRAVGTIDNLTIADCYVHDCNNSGVSIQADAASRLAIRGNRIRQIALTTAGVGIQVYGVSLRYNDVVIQGNHVTDLGATGIPIEITGTQRASIVGNTISGVGTRGISCGDLLDSVVSGNTITDQTLYGVELNTWTRCTVVGNTIKGCASGMSGVTCVDLLIEGNLIANTVSTYATPHGVFIQTAGTKRLTIRGNHLVDIAGLGVRVTSAPQDVAVVGNTFVNQTTVTLHASAGSNALSIDDWVRGVVRGNVIHFGKVDLDGVPYALIDVAGAATDLLIADNTIRSASGGILTKSAIGVRALATGLRIRDNVITGFNTGINTSTGVGTASDDIQIRGNYVEGTTTPYSLKAENLRRTKVEVEGTAAPTAGTWAVGDIVWNTAPAAGGSPGWVCVTAGTPGTWKAMAVLAA